MATPLPEGTVVVTDMHDPLGRHGSGMPCRAEQQQLRSSWDAFVSATEEGVGAAEEAKQARWMHGVSMEVLSSIMCTLHDPADLRDVIENNSRRTPSNCSGRLTAAQVLLFREALLELLEGELGEHFTSKARRSWGLMLDQIGGALAYSRNMQQNHVKLISTSWMAANRKDAHSAEVDGDVDQNLNSASMRNLEFG
eukprot:TRINITY_DN91620_c0_g1_i1.p1 TRINITY_DN91620_c0_g1~~TRINITY_DN91620_c0_g1_i1.p1  ORF type:complete len:211 (+),score=46.48 TRINITY_DN91620_c0_g1_i1:46-633(+)